jgi:hypothetical protein
MRAAARNLGNIKAVRSGNAFRFGRAAPPRPARGLTRECCGVLSVGAAIASSASNDSDIRRASHRWPWSLLAVRENQGDWLAHRRLVARGIETHEPASSGRLKLNGGFIRLDLGDKFTRAHGIALSLEPLDYFAAVLRHA